jgi:uncharacterized protein (DUF362 family)
MKKDTFSRRNFIKNITAGGAALSLAGPLHLLGRESAADAAEKSELFHIDNIPEQPFSSSENSHYHAGAESLLKLMGSKGLKFYRSSNAALLSGPDGLIEPHDVVLIKVNAQWKYRGATNSDLIRGLIQRILDHPDGFTGEVVIVENGQGRGSLACDTTGAKVYPDAKTHANALNEKHSFLYLVNSLFQDPRVSAFLLDPVRDTFISDQDHVTNGYRSYARVSYPCFTTAGGSRVELREGLWTGNGYAQNLKLINVPVLKHHDQGGSEITGALKHFYGLVSMRDGRARYRHYQGLGYTAGTMIAKIRTPVLNIMDAIWVSHRALAGYPEQTTFNANQITASQDPVALDYWTAKHVMYPIDRNERHHPDFPIIDRWLEDAKVTINQAGGLYHPEHGIAVKNVTKNENRMRIHRENTEFLSISGRVLLGETNETQGLGAVVMAGLPGNPKTQSDGRYFADLSPEWSGTVKPKKAGFLFQPQSRTYKSLETGLSGQNYTALRHIYAPADFQGKKIINRGLFMRETFHKLTWTPNPENSPARIRTYRIYRRTGGGWQLLQEVDASIREYIYKTQNQDMVMEYSLTAVNDYGREGKAAVISL